MLSLRWLQPGQKAPLQLHARSEIRFRRFCHFTNTVILYFVSLKDIGNARTLHLIILYKWHPPSHGKVDYARLTNPPPPPQSPERSQVCLQQSQFVLAVQDTTVRNDEVSSHTTIYLPMTAYTCLNRTQLFSPTESRHACLVLRGPSRT